MMSSLVFRDELEVAFDLSWRAELVAFLNFPVCRARLDLWKVKPVFCISPMCRACPFNVSCMDLGVDGVA